MKTTIHLQTHLVVFTIVEGQVVTDPYGNPVGTGFIGAGIGDPIFGGISTPISTIGAGFPVSTIGAGIPVSTVGTGLPVSTIGTGPVTTFGAGNGGTVFPPGLPAGKCYCQCPAGYQNGPAFFVGNGVPSFYASLATSAVPSAPTAPVVGTGIPITGVPVSGVPISGISSVGTFDPTSSGALAGFGAVGVPTGFDPTTSGALAGFGSVGVPVTGVPTGFDPTTSGALGGFTSSFEEVDETAEADASRFGFRSYGMK
jgi:hypothetical protein